MEVLILEKDIFLSAFRDSLKAINEERLFSTERGYQAQLYSELETRLKINKFLHGGRIIENESQKTPKKHGIYKRPDIIIHIPYKEEIHSSRRYGNYVVIQLKLNANKEKAKDDFEKLDLMFDKNNLDYQIGIFLNINSDKTFFDSYSGNYKNRLHCFAVKLSNSKVLIYESP